MKFKYIPEGTPPCVNCITLGICKGIVNDSIKFYEGYGHASMLDKREYICEILFKKCSLLDDFVCIGMDNSKLKGAITLYSVNRKLSVFNFFCPEDLIDDSLPRLSDFSSV